MWRILAIADLTFKESARRRVFLSLACFAALLIALAVSLPAIDAEAKIRLVQSWCLRTISFFGVLIAVFMSATSIPDDIEARKLYLVLTKPVTRLQALAGKLLGFALVLLLFVGAMGLLSAIYVRCLDGSLFGKGSGFLEMRTRIEPVSFALEHPSDAPGGAAALLAEDEEPWLWVRWSPKSRLIWTFAGLDRLPLGDRVRGELTVRAGSPGAMYAADGTIRVRPSQGEERGEVHPDCRLRWNVPHHFEFSRDVVDRLSGRVLVEVLPANSRSEIGASPTSLALFTEPLPFGFERNFAKSLLTTYAELLMVATLTTMGSTAVSGPVSIFLGLFFFFAGSMVGFVRGSLRAVEATIRTLALRAQSQHWHPDPNDPPVWMLEFSQQVSDLVIRVIPDLDRFDTPERVLRGVEIPLAHILDLCGYAGVYAGLAFLLGWMFFSLRELK